MLWITKNNYDLPRTFQVNSRRCQGGGRVEPRVGVEPGLPRHFNEEGPVREALARLGRVLAVLGLREHLKVAMSN